MNFAPAAMPRFAVSASSTVPRPRRTLGSSFATCAQHSMALGVVMVSSMQVRPPAARARAQSSRLAELSARMSAMTFSD
jgi:hypothetical protein